MGRFPHPEIPADPRTRLEQARLDLLALFRALDRMDLTPAEIPQRLIRQLFELDADCVRALWALDQCPDAPDLNRMLRGTIHALQQLPAASHRFKKRLPPSAQPTLAHLQASIRPQLLLRHAYIMVPGRDPNFC